MMAHNFSSEANAIYERLRAALVSIRTGRASVALVENLDVEYYGSKTPLKALAALSLADPMTVVIQPWDKTSLPAIEKAVQDSSLGMRPIADRNLLRLSIPPLTEERRKELVRVISRHAEDARILVRRLREESLREINRTAESENEKFRRRQELQKTVDDINKKIQTAATAKEEEVLRV
ncbi:MAG: ribosome recycling factor [Candidatus Sungbacteria bacterium]|nr:ribosome recycling factor [Candidatus Sungbacteria bacterium]